MKNKKEIKVLVIILLMVALIAGVLFAIKLLKNKKTGETGNLDEADNTIVVGLEEKKTPKTFAGNERPIAIMLDNHEAARPQYSITKADVIYEIIVEGGMTRFMAVYKNADDVSKIGPVRSSRHYFLDYALENDAIYAHFGWSPQAESDISSLKVNNINGLTSSSSVFWRTSDKSAPHNVATSIAKLYELAKSKGYSTTTDKDTVLNYVVDEVNMGTDAVDAKTITIPYSNSYTVKYEYDESTKTYVRYTNGKKHTDGVTGEALTRKNIIVSLVPNYALNDGSGKDRQGLNNIGTFQGYYISNGKAMKITCEKSARKAQTVYKDLTGKEIDVNDGSTIFNICPKDANVTIVGAPATTTAQ